MTRELRECQERLETLEEENGHLRRSAEDFGRLAERLNRKLRDNRRQGGDRRHEPRDSPERRSNDAADLVR